MITDKLIYRLLAAQVPVFWEAIKFCCKSAGELADEDLPYYFNNLLQDLLSDKAQCFVVLSKDRILETVIVTRLTVNKLTRRKELYVENAYSVVRISDAVLNEIGRLGIDFAKKEECKTISFNSRVSRVWELGLKLGFTEQYRTYTLRLGGA